MSASTRSCGRDGRPLRAAARLVVALCATLLIMPLRTAFAADAPPLPPQVAALAPGLKAQGGGELTYFGLSIYDGYFWSPRRGWKEDGPCALDLHYHRGLDGAKIAARSLQEITKLGYGTPEQRSRWGEAMRRLFPNVEKGDRLTGISLPGGIVRYFHNDRPIGDIDEPGFGRAFFAIWLDPKTSEAAFRQLLLGEKP